MNKQKARYANRDVTVESFLVQAHSAVAFFVSISLFFFSSRRRHTRFDCDWSSDVCSSDLSVTESAKRHGIKRFAPMGEKLSVGTSRLGKPAAFGAGVEAEVRRRGEAPRHRHADIGTLEKIGRASCRERVEIWVVGGGLKRR